MHFLGGTFPNGGTNHNCASMGPTGWEDSDCNVVKPAICQYISGRSLSLADTSLVMCCFFLTIYIKKNNHIGLHMLNLMKFQINLMQLKPTVI